MIESGKLTKAEQRQVALEFLERLDVSRDYRTCFNMCRVDFFGVLGSYFNECKLSAVIKELEEKTGIFIYYVMKDLMPFGTCYSFLYVSSYVDDVELQREMLKASPDLCFVSAYVWNKTFPENSEFGSVVVRALEDGSLFRIE